MAIFRGIGGAGDSTTDATVTAVTQQAANAASSALAASSSASAAATSASSAGTSASNASSSKASAAASASSAAASATSATASKVAAAASETAAGASETAAAASESAAATSASNAASSASSASTSASTATTQASSATSSATTATTKASEAVTSASNAATSETNAASSASAASSSASSASASADAALSALDSFDDRYLGQKTSNPTVDNDGNALIAGALYFNTTDSVMKVYEGSVWVAAYASLSGALLQVNNLSDVANVIASRTNLGLGTAATTDATDYATAAQGATADTAVQPNTSPTFTGIDVTGTVVADGLEVSGDVYFTQNTNADVFITATPTTSSRIWFGDTDSSTAASIQYQHSNDSLKFATNGNTERMRITSAGDVGIGTSLPTDKLHVSGESFPNIKIETNSVSSGDSTLDLVGYRTTNSPVGYLKFWNNATSPTELARVTSYREGADNTGNLLFYTSSAGSLGERMRIDSAGNIGIGTSSPSTDLDVFGGIRSTASGGYNQITTTSIGDAAFNNNGNNWLTVKNGVPANAMRIDSAGNVGIGATSPSQLLEVRGAAARIRITDTDTSGTTGIEFVDSANTVDAEIEVGNSTQYFAVKTAGSEAMRIDGAGNVGIGTDSPASRLHVSDSGAVADNCFNVSTPANDNVLLGANLVVDAAGNYTKPATSISGAGILFEGINSADNHGSIQFLSAPDTNTVSATPLERMRIDSAGNVGIGTSAPSYKLHVDGDIYATGNVTAYSDIKLKTNIRTIEGALDLVGKMRGVRYDRIDTGEASVGVIAQEMREVLPEVVTEKDGAIGVAYGNISGVLIEAINELRAEVTELRAEIKALKGV